MYEVTVLRLVIQRTMLTGPNLAGTVKAPLNALWGAPSRISTRAQNIMCSLYSFVKQF